MCEDHAPAVATEVKGIAAESQQQQRGRGGAATRGKSGHSLRRVAHAPASDGRMMSWLVVVKSGGAQEHDEVAHDRVRFPKIDRSNFRKPNLKTSKRERSCGWEQMDEAETRRSTEGKER